MAGRGPVQLGHRTVRVPVPGAGQPDRDAEFSVGQLKILQEVVTLSVFVPFSIWYLREPVKLDYLWAGLCLCGAVYFVFRGGAGPAQ